MSVRGQLMFIKINLLMTQKQLYHQNELTFEMVRTNILKRSFRVTRKVDGTEAQSILACLGNVLRKNSPVNRFQAGIEQSTFHFTFLKKSLMHKPQ